nr:hypothetical protein [Tanacetum cinerariifolium]
MVAYINSEPWKFQEAFDKELESPMEDQPLPTNTSPTALLPGYINDSNPEEDEEDPVDYPANRGDNDDNESSDDDNDDDDDDVEKDGEDDEEVEHLAPVDPSVVPIDDHACIIEFAVALPSSLPPPPPENIKSLKDNIRV